MVTSPKPTANTNLKRVSEGLFETTEKIESTHTNELVIAVCGPIGSPLHDVASKFQENLANTFGYEKCEILRLSKIIEEKIPLKDSKSEFLRISGLIENGNELRRKYGANVLAELAVHAIRLERERIHIIVSIGICDTEIRTNLTRI